MISTFFKLEVEKHMDTCNEQCLNATIYKKNSKKNEKILGKYVELCPHLKSLDGINAPSNKELMRLGFFDVNITFTNIVEILENASSRGLYQRGFGVDG